MTPRPRPRPDPRCATPNCPQSPDETVLFALDGQSYEIDLCNAHAEQLRDDVEEFVGPARPVAIRRTAARRRMPAEADGATEMDQAERTRQTVARLQAAGEAAALRRQQQAGWPAGGRSSTGSPATGPGPDAGHPTVASGPDLAGVLAPEPAVLRRVFAATDVLLRAVRRRGVRGDAGEGD